MSILTLPTDYLIEVLSSWIKVQDLTKLDSSVVNSSVRTLFLQTISLPYFVLDESVAYEFYEIEYGCYKWMLLKQVRSARIIFESVNKEAYLVEFFQLQENTIRCLDLLRLQEGRYDSTLCAGCVNLTSLSLHSNLWDVASSLPCPEILKSLTLRYTAHPKELNAFVSVCKNIEFLSLAEFVLEDTNDDTPIDLNNLLKLNVWRNSQHFGWLTKFTKKLKTIIYKSNLINELDLNNIVEHCTRLESVIMLSDDNNIPIQFVESLVSNNKNLTCLTVYSNGNADNILRNLILHCSSMHSINLNGTYASETMWIKFVTAFPSLVHLNLGKSTTLTSVFIKALTSSCHNIKYLNMNELMSSDEDVIMITQTYSKLKILNICLTNVALETIALNCSHLETLVISCGNMSIESIQHLVKSCTQLQYIKLKNSQITESQLELLQRTGLRIIVK